jgi:hypothetical protein
MRQESPSLLWITMHDIDIAHSGAFSLYVDAIRRTDRLCAELWKAVQEEPEYAGNTTMLILPDFGRDADEDSGGNGFQHHRTGDPASRTTWMMALGAGCSSRRGLRQPRAIDRPGAEHWGDDGIFCGAGTRQTDQGTALAYAAKELHADQFSAYPAQAKRLAIAHVQALQQLPLSFLPGLLRQVIEYDYKFPAEQAAIDKELANLSSLSREQIQDWFEGFLQLTLSSKLERLDWVNQPALFLEQESAYLWSTHQMDAFQAAATRYGDRLQAVMGVEALPVRRLGIAVIGQGVESFDSPLFRNLRAHGTFFTQIKPEGGVELLLLAVVEARAQSHPLPYRHWYIDGGQIARPTPSLTTVSYAALAPVREGLLKFMQNQIARPGMGPEELRTNLARLLPADLGMDGRRRCGAGSLSGKAVHGGLGHPNLQHYVCAVDHARGIAPRPAAYAARTVCSPPTAEADERAACRHANA